MLVVYCTFWCFLSLPACPLSLPSRPGVATTGVRQQLSALGDLQAEQGARRAAADPVRARAAVPPRGGGRNPSPMTTTASQAASGNKHAQHRK